MPCFSRNLSQFSKISLLNLKKENVIIFRWSSTKSGFLQIPFGACQQLQSLRYVRTGSHSKTEKNKASEDKEQEKNESNEDEKKSEEPSVEELAKKIDPSVVRRLRIFMIVVVVSTTVISLFMLQNLTRVSPDLQSAMDQEPIEFDVFVKKYLPTGEVQKLVYCPEEKRAIAVLQPGAIIDGQPAPVPVLAIKFERASGEQPNQFRYEVRHAEELLGIPQRDSIPIDIFHAPSLIKILEMAVGFAILGFLFTQYGRLVRRTILKKRAEDAAKKIKEKQTACSGLSGRLHPKPRLRARPQHVKILFPFSIKAPFQSQMLSAAISLFEFLILFFAAGRALVSIVNPKIQHAFYSLLFVLPISIILPVFVARAEAQVIEEKEN
ncbi:hypothetical protein FO519_006477 [Halicephalobus sp. NKZ332]|nr:hypothetical protein FO519_006477 [Halicephalobus sp. NKZ332]